MPFMAVTVLSDNGAFRNAFCDFYALPARFMRGRGTARGPSPGGRSQRGGGAARSNPLVESVTPNQRCRGCQECSEEKKRRADP